MNKEEGALRRIPQDVADGFLVGDETPCGTGEEGEGQDDYGKNACQTMIGKGETKGSFVYR